MLALQSVGSTWSVMNEQESSPPGGSRPQTVQRAWACFPTSSAFPLFAWLPTMAELLSGAVLGIGR